MRLRVHRYTYTRSGIQKFETNDSISTHKVFATPLVSHIVNMPVLPSPITIYISFFFVAAVTSLTWNAGQLLIVEPSATYSTSTPSANVSLSDGGISSPSNLSHLILQCDPQYGDNLSYRSCRDAYNQIPHVVPEMTWGPRTQGRWAINLPWRIYSCEQYCP